MDKIKSRFISKYTINQITNCYEWNIPKGSNYNNLAFSIHNKKHLINRAAYMLFKGPIKDTDLVIRSCKNNYCVNPDHLFLGNIQDHNKIRNKSHKITEKDKQEMYSLYMNGWNNVQIGKKFNVSETAIRKILGKIPTIPKIQTYINNDDMADQLKSEIDKQFEDLFN
jgi:hypothetical protein